MQKLLRLHAVVCVLLLSSPITHAALVEGNCDGTPDENITCDQSTGLEWLDLTETTNISPNALLGGAGGFINLFRHATHAEVDTLFLNAGWDGIDRDPTNHSSAQNFTAVALLNSLLDITFTGANTGGQGFAAQRPDSLFPTPFYEIPGASLVGRFGGTTLSPNPFFLTPGNVAAPTHGHYLVRISSLSISIDIKPGSDPNSINLCSKGSVPIAILGSETFNVFDVVTQTLRFADTGVKMVGKKDPFELCSYEDVNFDGDDDLVCHFVTMDIASLNGASTTATLNGELTDGTPIEGSDSVNIAKDTCW